MDMTDYGADAIQHDLFGCLPGAPGGRALRDQRGHDYLRQLATTGGQTTRDRYGLAYMQRLAAAGGRAKRHKEDTQPRTITHWDGTRRRIVPYRPPRSRRRRPDKIHFFLDSDDALTRLEAHHG